MELYKIWATFDLRGNALQKMEQYAKLVSLATKENKILNETLTMTNTRLNSLANHLSKVNPHLKTLSASFAGLKTNSNASKVVFSNFNRVIGTTSEKTQTLISKTDRLAINMERVANRTKLASEEMAAMSTLGRMGSGGGSGGGGARRGGGSGGHRNSFMHGAMHGAGVGGALGYMGVGALGAYAAFATVKHGFDVSSDYKMLQAQLTALGYHPDQVQAANNFVMNSDIQGVSKIDMMKAYLDAQMATREMPGTAISKGSETREFAPMLAKLQFSAKMYGGITDNQVMDTIKFAEGMGGSSLQKRKQWLDAASQIMVSSGMSINPTELRTFSRQASGAFSYMDPEALVGLEPLLQEGGTAKAATGFVTGLRTLVTGTGSNFNKKQINFLEKLGILTASYDSEGRPLGVKMPRKYEETLGKDPYLFIRDVLVPKFKAAGIDINDPVAMGHAFTLSLPRTMAQQAQTVWKSREIIERQRAQLHHIGGIESNYDIALKQQGMAPELVGAAWADFSKAIGDLTGPGIAAGLRGLAFWLEYLAKFLGVFTASPEMKKYAIDKQSANISKMASVSPILNSLNSSSEAKNKALYDRKANMYQYHSGYYDSVFSKGGVVSPIQKTNGNHTFVLQTDGQKFAKIVVPHITNMVANGGVNNGTSYHNMSITPTSTNYNGAGNP